MTSTVAISYDILPGTLPGPTSGIRDSEQCFLRRLLIFLCVALCDELMLHGMSRSYFVFPNPCFRLHAMSRHTPERSAQKRGNPAGAAAESKRTRSAEEIEDLSSSDLPSSSHRIAPLSGERRQCRAEESPDGPRLLDTEGTPYQVTSIVVCNASCKHVLPVFVVHVYPISSGLILLVSVGCPCFQVCSSFQDRGVTGSSLEGE